MPIPELLKHALHLVMQDSNAAGLPGNFADIFAPTQPEPVLFPRKSLTQVFAVLLMRSAYEAVDDLNFIPMVRLALCLCTCAPHVQWRDASRPGTACVDYGDIWHHT